MTTLTEFKEIEIHDMDDTEITRLYENALPALIDVAEGMAKSLSALLDFEHPQFEDHYQTLAAYEAWKGKIEGEGK